MLFNYFKVLFFALMLIFLGGCRENQSSPDPTSEPTVTPTPQPTPSPEPTASPTPQPTPEPTAIPTPQPTPMPEPTTWPTPTPEPTASPTPTPQPLVVDAGSDKVARKGELVRLTAKVETNETNLTYSWKEDGIVIGTQQYLSKSDWSVGLHTILLSVEDLHGYSGEDEVLVTIEDKFLIEDIILQEQTGWQAVLTMSYLTPNQTSGTVDYLAYECGGDLIYLGDNNLSEYIFDEVLKYGVANCEEGCQIWLSNDGSSYKKYCNNQLVTQGKLATPLDIDLYQKVAIEEPSAGMDNNGSDILYATQTGQLYRLDFKEAVSTPIATLTDSNLVNGLAYFEKDIYYYSYTLADVGYFMERVDLNTTIVDSLEATRFPDGLDIYNKKLYSVTQDVSGVLTIFDLNGTQEGTIDTAIDDIVGIAHTQYFLYILSEDGDIYQTNPTTGQSKRIFNNDNLFEKGNNSNGLEAITVLDNYIYISYINDAHIYKIDVNLTQYE